ncbi:hypothetical protein DAD186_16170 [Dermabacter vaginalis]|uniref:Uncharacterized protein n=1 Tax=Dermabacter vaginalis TaxID=1630135 RepID=A0A1B0ZJU6_9MICO|nr:hypothetical protein DAD186_16170 [Dermabacter vaginalis]
MEEIRRTTPSRATIGGISQGKPVERIVELERPADSTYLLNMQVNTQFLGCIRPRAPVGGTAAG